MVLDCGFGKRSNLLTGRNVGGDTFHTGIGSRLCGNMHISIGAVFSGGSISNNNTCSNVGGMLLRPVVNNALFARSRLLRARACPSFSTLSSDFSATGPLMRGRTSASGGHSHVCAIGTNLRVSVLGCFA